MTIEPLGLRRPTLSKSSKKTKSMIVILAIVLIILIFGVYNWNKRSSVFSYKTSICLLYKCESKVLTLAAHGVVTAVEGFNAAMDECTHVIGPNSIYGEASM